MRMNKLITGILVMLATGCTPFLKDGPYEGFVVDIDTGKPIEGAVVAMSWWKWYPTVAGVVHNCYDSDETKTNNKGYFKLRGKGIRILSNLSEPYLVVLKEGYWREELYFVDGKRKLEKDKKILLSDICKHDETINSSSGLICEKGKMPFYDKEYHLTNMAFVRRKECFDE